MTAQMPSVNMLHTSPARHNAGIITVWSIENGCKIKNRHTRKTTGDWSKSPFPDFAVPTHRKIDNRRLGEKG